MNVCVFCASRDVSPMLEAGVKQVLQVFIKKKWGLVYGGGRVGVMGLTADEFRSAGANTIGVIPDFLKDKEVAHEGLSELVVVNSMLERKRIMIERSDAFLVLPGGIGTLDELLEVMTMKQLKVLDAPVYLYNGFDFFQTQLAFFDELAQMNLLHSNWSDLLHIFTESQQLEQLVAP